MRFRVLCAAVLLGACSDVTPTNPYDPAAPATVQRSANLSGRLVLPAGFDADALLTAEVALQDLAGDADLRVGVDDEGRFAFGELTPGRYRVRPEVGGFTAAPIVVALGIGEVLDLGPIELAPAVVLGGVRGRAERAGAASHDGIAVRARGTRYGTATDALGQFWIELPGRVEPYTLELTAAGHAPVQLDVRVRDGEIEALESTLVLPAQPGTLRGGVALEVLEVGDHFERVTVELARGDGVEQTTPLLADGRFAVELPPGAWEVTARLEGYEAVTERAEVLPGGVTEVATLRLPARLALVTGRVLLGGAETHGGTRVLSLETGAQTQTEADGGFELALLARRHTVRVVPPDGYTVPEGARETRVELSPGEERPLWSDDLVVTPLPVASLHGRLLSALDPDDWASRAVIGLASEDGAVQRLAPALRDGRFRFSGVPPGRYDVSVSARGHQPHTERGVELVEGENGPLEIPLVSDVVEAGAYVLGGRVLLGGVAEDGDHSGTAVRGRIGGVLVFATVTDETGAFVTPVAHDTHALTFAHPDYASAAGTLSWLVEAEAFTYEGRPLGDVGVFETLAPLNVGAVSGVLRSPLGVRDWARRGIVSLIGEGEQRLATLSTNADGDGAFEVANLRPGLYTLNVEVRGHRPWIEPALEVPARALALEAPIDLVPEEVRYGGRVTDRDRRAIPGVVVRARIEDNVIDTAISDADGAFTLTLVPETHALSFARAGYVGPEGIFLDWQDGAFAVRDGRAFEMQAVTGTLTVTVDVHPEWIPERQRVVRVRVSGEGVDRVDERVGDGAPVQFADLPAGTYVVLAERAGFGSDQRLVTLDERQPNPSVGLSVGLLSLDGAGLDLRGAEVTDSQLAALNLRGANLSGIELRPADGQRVNLCGVDLSGADLVGTALDGANLAGADLSGTTLANSSLGGASLAGADLTGTSFFGADLRDADFAVVPDGCAPERDETVFDATDFADANLAGAAFTAAPDPLPPGYVEVDCDAVRPEVALDLTAVDFSGANLSAATLVGVDLTGVDLSSASLQGTDLRGAELGGAAVVLSDLSDARFECARLRRSSFLGSVLARADFRQADLRDATMTEAVVDGTRFVRARLERSRFVGVLFADADLSGAVFTDADLRNAEFVDTRFHNGLDDDGWWRLEMDDFLPIELRGALLNNASLSDANLRRVDMTDALMRGADLTGANLREATLGRDLAGASLVGANLVDADLSDSRVADAVLQGPNPGRRAYYSLGTRWPELVPVPKFLRNPCAGKGEQDAPPAWPEEDPTVPTQAHFVHACSNLSALRRNPDEAEEEEELGIEVRAAKDFTRADLSMLDLRWADLTLAILREADLRGVDLTLGSMRQADFVGARLRDDDVDPPVKLRLAGVNLRDTVFAEDEDLSGFSFAGGALQGATFVGTNLRRADLRQAFVAGADFTRADLTDALLDGTVFDPTTIWPPDPFDPAALGAQDLPDDFVRIEPGAFLWHGSREVRISRPFLIHKTEVTAGQYRAALNGARCWNDNDNDWPSEVTCHMSVHQAIAYVNALSTSEGLESCYPSNSSPGFNAMSLDCEGYRVPTDAEWEYAARAGETGPVFAEPTGERCSVIPLHQQELWSRGPVSGPNAWGLSDTYGRYPEWVHHRAGATVPDGAVDPLIAPGGSRNEHGFLDCFARGGGFSGPGWNACTLSGGVNSPCYGGSERSLRPVRTLRVPPPPEDG